MIYIDTDDTQSFTDVGGEFWVTVYYYDDAATYLPTVTGSSWITVTLQGGTQGEERYSVTVAENPGTSSRSGVITFKMLNTDQEYETVDLYIYQSYLVAGPIWYDTLYTESNTRDFAYTLELDGETIYSGMAVRQPGTSGPVINISKICQDYLHMELPDFRNYNNDVFSSPDAIKSFNLLVYGEARVTYKFMYNWSYDFDRMPYKNPVRDVFTSSQPINGHLDPRMKMMITYYSAAKTPVVPYTIDGVSHTKTFKTGVSTWVRDVSDLQGSTLVLKSVKYTVDYCGDYALYYKNRSGGYDSFLIEGNVAMSDKYDRASYAKAYYNTNPMNWGTNTYHNEITTSYTLHTGWLSDSESQILAFNLLPSNEVFLHNLTDNTIVPVIITNSEVSYKTYKSNSHKLVNYEITVEKSQKKQLI